MDLLLELLGRLLPPGAGDAVGVWVSFVLTLMVFSYILGDNPFFRLAQHLLIGSVAAYAVVVTVHGVLIERLLIPLIARTETEWPLIVPFILGVLLLAKARTATAWLGNVSIGFMLGVGAALGISGALFGTLLPQLRDTSLSLASNGSGGLLPLDQIFSNLVIVVGTLGALLSFHFARGRENLLGRVRNSVLLTWGTLGRGFIFVTFGSLFAGIALSRVTLLVSRVQFILSDVFKLSVR